MKSKDTILSVIRHVLTFGGGFAVAKGYISEATMVQLVGGLAGLIGLIWGAVDEHKAANAKPTA